MRTRRGTRQKSDIALQKPANIRGTEKTEAEQLLIQRINNREEKALADFYLKYKDLMARIIVNITRDHSLTDDIINLVLLQIWNGIKNFDPSLGELEGWTITLTRRRSLDRVRQTKAYVKACQRFFDAERRGTDLSEDRAETMPSWIHASRSETREKIEKLLRHPRMPQEQADVLSLHYLSGLSHRGIAGTTGLPLGTVRTRLRLGYRKLVALTQNTAFRELAIA